MIELIFAIVVVAIVMLTIPMIIRVMNQSQELSVGQEIFAKMYAQAQRKSMNPWDQNVSNVILTDSTDGTILHINGVADLNCSRSVGSSLYRENNISTRECNQAFLAASAITNGDANGTLGIEHYNNTSITIVDPVNGNYTANIAVSYVDDGDDTPHNGHYSTTWFLGDDAAPSGSGSAPSHLKRVVMRFSKPDNTTIPVTTFTFFMSNIGVVQ